MTIRIGMLTTYPPTQCGIATFARSLSRALTSSDVEIDIVRVGNDGSPSKNPLVISELRRRDDIPKAVHALNSRDIVIIQHEFGIYGGREGSDILDIVGGLNVPVVTVLHTVTEHPSEQQRRIIQGLINSSDRIVVLSKSSLRALLRTYDADVSRIHLVQHGASRLIVGSRSRALRMRPRILTWGLMGDGKGVEWGIEALAQLEDVDPTPDYYVVGTTHPKVLKREGTRYLDSLRVRARALGVGERVQFIDAYLDTQTLARLIISADMYLLPYDSRDQAASGVLVEALVAGGPVIATRFPHAVELLGDGTGLLVDHESPASIADAVRRFMRNPDLQRQMRERSLHKATSFLWSNVGASFADVIYAARRTSRMSRRDELDVAQTTTGQIRVPA